MRNVVCVVYLLTIFSCAICANISKSTDNSDDNFIKFLEFVIENSRRSNCTEELNIILTKWKITEIWALKFIESTGHFPKDKFEFDDIFEIGNFARCINSEFKEDERKIQGKHCTTDISIPHFIVDKEKTPKLSDPNQLIYVWGICIPKSCSADEINTWFSNSSNRLMPENMSIKFIEEKCRTKISYQLTTADMIVTALFGILVVIVLISTICEIIMEKCKEDRIFSCLTYFSLIANSKELFKIEPVKRNGRIFYSLYGIRVISINLIIYYHLTVLLGYFPHFDYNLQLDSLSMIPYIVGTLPVDVFFVMSGLLCMFQILRRYQNGFKLKNIPNYILFRYLRYTPMYLACIGIYLTYGNYVKSTTISSVDHIVEPCRKHLWENLLFVQNYLWLYTHPAEIPCIIHSWYIAAEFQLYLFSIIVLVFIQRLRKITYHLLVGLTILPSIFIILAASKYKIIEVAQAHNYTLFLYQQSKIYYFTHERAGPYFIGMILGYYLFQHKGTRPVFQKLTITILWILTILTIFGVLILHSFFAQAWHEYDSIVDPTFEGLHRTIFSIGIALLIFLCENDCGGFIDKILSFKYWQPFGKLTYGVYLLHFLYIVSYYKQHNGPIKYSQFLDFNSIICVYIVTVLMAIPLYLCVELPFCKIGKQLFDNR